MTKEELAGQLNGREYLREIMKSEAEKARANNLLVVFGSSDDLLEFRGTINDEVGAYEGTVVYLSEGDILQNKCKDDGCPYFEEIRRNAKDKVTAL